MRIAVDRAEILPLLEKAGSVAPAKGQAEFLRAIWIRARSDRIRVMATDSTTEYSGTCPVQVDEPGLVGVSRQLVDLVKKLPSGEVNLSVEDSTCRVASGRRRYTLPVYDSSWFQHATEPEHEYQQVSAGMFLLLIGADVAFCAHQEPTEEAMHCTQVQCEDEQHVRVWALDGHKLAIIRGLEVKPEIMAQLQSGRKPGMQLARPHVQMLAKLISKMDRFGDDVWWSVDARRVHVHDGRHAMSCPAQRFPVPEVDRILGACQGTYSLTVDVPLLIEALDRIGVFTSEENRGVRCSFQGDYMQLEIDTDRGRATEIVHLMDPCQAESLNGLTMSVRQWLDVLKRIGQIAETGQISMTRINGPVMHRPMVTGDNHMQVILMPLQADRREL